MGHRALPLKRRFTEVPLHQLFEDGFGALGEGFGGLAVGFGDDDGETLSPQTRMSENSGISPRNGTSSRAASCLPPP